MKTIVAAAGAGLVAVALAGCGGSGSRHAAPPPSSKEPATKAPVRRPVRPPCRAGSEQPVGTSRVAYAALVRHRAVAYRAPGRRPFATFGRLNVNGARTVLGIRAQIVRGDCSPRWFRVQLPVRPNGVQGYVRARAVEVSAVHTRIVVDLSARRLVLYRNGRPVLRALAGVGARATPTPTGRFYVDERLIPGDPTGPWGPGAIGIAAHSNVLQYSWIQGAPIAIHGTDEPSTVGHAASHGCIRLDNHVLRRLFRRTQPGTPVVIRA